MPKCIFFSQEICQALARPQEVTRKITPCIYNAPETSLTNKNVTTKLRTKCLFKIHMKFVERNTSSTHFLFTLFVMCIATINMVPM